MRWERIAEAQDTSVRDVRSRWAYLRLHTCVRVLFHMFLDCCVLQIFLGIPRLSQRKEILRALCTVAPDAAPPGGATPVSPAVDLDALAEATPGFTGADMQSLLNAAAHDAFMRAHDKVPRELNFRSDCLLCRVVCGRVTSSGVSSASTLRACQSTRDTVLDWDGMREGIFR